MCISHKHGSIHHVRDKIRPSLGMVLGMVLEVELHVTPAIPDELLQEILKGEIWREDWPWRGYPDQKTRAAVNTIGRWPTNQARIYDTPGTMQNEETVGRSGAPNSGPWRMSHHRNHLIATSWDGCNLARVSANTKTVTLISLISLIKCDQYGAMRHRTMVLNRWVESFSVHDLKSCEVAHGHIHLDGRDRGVLQRSLQLLLGDTGVGPHLKHELWHEM